MLNNTLYNKSSVYEKIKLPYKFLSYFSDISRNIFLEKLDSFWGKRIYKLK